MKYSIRMRVLAVILSLFMIVPHITVLCVSSPYYNINNVQDDQQEDIREDLKIALIDIPVTYPEAKYTPHDTYLETLDHQEALVWFVSQLRVEIESGLYTDKAESEMLTEINRLEHDIQKFQLDIEKFNKWQEEYPIATEVWFYLRNQGYSEVVTAGIIGNMMIETAGGTLHLKSNIYDYSGYFYGLCQWSTYYYPKVVGSDTIGQLDFLMSNIEYEFRTFGFCYYSGFTYNDFLSLEYPEDAAHAFAKVYERCASGSYGMRKTAARTAYNYFVLGE